MILALDRLFKVVAISGITTVALLLLQNLTLPANTPAAIKSHEGVLRLLTAVGIGVVLVGGDKKQSQIDVLNELKKKLVTASPAEAIRISQEIRLLEGQIKGIEEVCHVQENQKVRNESSIGDSSGKSLATVSVHPELNGAIVASDANGINELMELSKFYEIKSQERA